MRSKLDRVPMSLATLLSLALLMVACSPAAAPTPTAAPKKDAPATSAPATQPAKAAEPTKAPAEPTKAAAPAKKVDWPEKGKAVSLLVPFPAGGGADIGARIIVSSLEKELGVPVQVVNKGGAGSQVGLTEAAKAKPDGYTVGYANLPTAITIYLDPDRKAAFGRKDIQPVAMHVLDPLAIAVKADSPYKSLKDLVEASKTNPEKIKGAVGGQMGPEHFAWLQLNKQEGAKVNVVVFDGGAQALTAVLGGHVDALCAGFSGILPQAKSGQVRILATMEQEGKQFLPGIQTMEEQGYKGFYGMTRNWFVPAGTPKEIVEILEGAIKRAMDTEDHTKRALESGQAPRFMPAAQLATYWDQMEPGVKQLMEEAKAQQK